jgi:hypothetical protein
MAFINMTLASRGRYELAVLGDTYRLELGNKRIKINLRVKRMRVWI